MLDKRALISLRDSLDRPTNTEPREILVPIGTDLSLWPENTREYEMPASVRGSLTVECETMPNIKEFIDSILSSVVPESNSGGLTPRGISQHAFDSEWKSVASKYQNKERKLAKKARRKLIKQRRKQKC
jgi:hypothetical protein